MDFQYHGDFCNVLLCAQPKSASLYITQLIADSLSLRNFQIGFNLGGGSLYFPRLLAAKFENEDTISHCHESPNNSLLLMIKNYNFRPIILTRNLSDTLISRKEMLVKDKHTSELLSPQAINKYLSSNDEYQLDLIIDIFAPIYINFYTGWKSVTKSTDIKPLFITYEELLTSQSDLVAKVAKFLNRDFDNEITNKKIKNIMEKGGINFNKGVAGRGLKLMNENHLKKIKQLAVKFECYDQDYLGFQV